MERRSCVKAALPSVTFFTSFPHSVSKSLHSAPAWCRHWCKSTWRGRRAPNNHSVPNIVNEMRMVCEEIICRNPTEGEGLGRLQLRLRTEQVSKWVLGSGRELTEKEVSNNSGAKKASMTPVVWIHARAISINACFCIYVHTPPQTRTA